MRLQRYQIEGRGQKVARVPTVKTPSSEPKKSIQHKKNVLILIPYTDVVYVCQIKNSIRTRVVF